MEWSNNTGNFGGIAVEAKRDSNSVSRKDGWLVLIRQASHPKGWGRVQLPFGSEDVKRDFPNYSVYLESHIWHGIVLEALSPIQSLSLEEAEALIERVWDWIGSFEKESIQKRRIRQVRDALNKCRDPELIEEVAALLGVRKYKSFQAPKEVPPAMYCGCGRRFQHAIIQGNGVLVFSNSRPQQQARDCMACINCGKFWTNLT